MLGPEFSHYFISMLLETGQIGEKPMSYRLPRLSSLKAIFLSVYYQIYGSHMYYFQLVTNFCEVIMVQRTDEKRKYDCDQMAVTK